MGGKNKKAKGEGTGVAPNTNSATNSDPDNYGSQSTHSPGGTTPPTTGYTQQEPDTTHSPRIVSPNIHLAITGVLIAVVFGQTVISYLMPTSSGTGKTVFESPTLKRLESECRQKDDDVIQCIKDMLEPQAKSLYTWSSEINTVYKSSKDFKECLQTLQDIHSYMNDNTITFSMVKKQVDSLHANVTSLLIWRTTTTEHIGTLRTDVQRVEEDLKEHKNKTDELSREAEKNITDLLDGISELKKNKPSPEKTDTGSWKEELATLAKNLSALAGNVSTFKHDAEQKLQNHEDQLKNIQNITLPRIKSDIDTTNNNLRDLTDTVKTNKEKIDERLQEHGSSIETIEGVLKTVQTGVSTLKDGLKHLDGKVDNNKRETDGQIQTIQSNHKTMSERVDRNKKDTDASLLDQDGQMKDIQGNLQTLSDHVDQNRKDTDVTLSGHRDQIKNIVEEQLPHLQIGIDDTKDKAKSAGNKASAIQEDLGNHKTWAEKRQDEYENYRKELKEKHGDTLFKQSVSQELIDEMRNKMVLHDASFYMGLLSIGCCVLLFMNMMKNYKGSGRTPENRTRAGNQLRPREDNDIYYLKWSGPKENSVCVVTFHSETEQQHAGETRSVFESVGAIPPLIHTRVIRRHTDIQDLPGSRIFLVFVDFNERNVILEDPAKGLGDLRVTTVRSLWKFGGDVAVIYCRDHGSRSLDGELFNRNLSSIYSQTELSQLKNQQRMLSIFEGFSDVQKQHCRDFIDRQLNRA